MVKLLRLKGDVSVSNKEIRNTFKQPVIIGPKSRIALAGMDVKLRSTGANQSFTIDSDNNSLEVDGTTVTLADGTYTLPELLDELTVKIALNAGTQAFAKGATDYRVSASGDKMVYIKHNSDINDAEFDAEFHAINGAPTVTDEDYTGDGTPCQIASHYTVPNGSSRIQGTIASTDDIDFGVIDEGGNYLMGLGINGTNYSRWFNGVETVTAVAATANDTFVLSRRGLNIVYQVRDAAGTIILSHAETMTETLWNNYLAENALWYVSTPDLSAGSITGVGLTVLDPPASGSLKTSQAHVRVLFNSTNLADYCGFSSVGPWSTVGNPAVLSSDGLITGENAYPGVMVSVDPFTLESYDGANTSTFKPNILHVIHNTKNFGKNLSFDVQNLIKLDIRNEGEINLNQIRVSFNSSVNGSQLTFAGDPVITLLIFDHDEA